MADARALPGGIWVCGACGKTSQWRYPDHGREQHPGWDVSCMLNAIHCAAEKVDGKWIPMRHPAEGAAFNERGIEQELGLDEPEKVDAAS